MYASTTLRSRGIGALLLCTAVLVVPVSMAGILFAVLYKKCRLEAQDLSLEVRDYVSMQELD
jgi:hypothetical protein